MKSCKTIFVLILIWSALSALIFYVPKEINSKYDTILWSTVKNGNNTSKCNIDLKLFYLKELPIEIDFPIAYSILVYRDVIQIYRLLRAIYRRHNYYCIYVDRKADQALFNTILSWTDCMPNLIVPDGQDRINVNWGRISIIKAELTCIHLLSKASKSWKYFINLTGQEFPLKTNLEIVVILKAFNGSNDIDSGLFPKDRLTIGYSEEGLSHKKYDSPPKGITLSKGSAHVILSRAFTDYVIANGSIVSQLLQWMRDINCADEAFFQTLNNNPQLRIPSTYMSPNVQGGGIARLKNWGDKQCYGKWLRDICLWGPKDFLFITSADKTQLFVNKFVMKINQNTYDMLEKWFQKRTLKIYSTGPSAINTIVYKKEKLRYSHF